MLATYTCETKAGYPQALLGFFSRQDPAVVSVLLMERRLQVYHVLSTESAEEP